MTDHLDSTNLVPFKRRRRSIYHLPDLMREQDDQIIEEVDPELRPEEQGFVRHYLAYADILLKNAPDTVEEEPQQHTTNTLRRHELTEILEPNGTESKDPKNNAA